jgi:hypothetical protein
MHNYTSIFHVGILDDLHNYFPDVLYNSERFTTVQELLQYIQHQARTQLNPFDRGQREYNNNNRPVNQTINPVNTYVQIPVVDVSGNTQTPITSNINIRNNNNNNTNPQTPPPRIRPAVRTTVYPPLRRSTPITSAYFYENYDDSIMGVNTLSNLFNLALNPSIANMIDVPIIPTNQQIDRATTLLTTAQQEPCAICQEGMDTSGLRRINQCQHTFHQSCIDTWFQSGVTCPICRIDIRRVDE